LFRAQSLLAAGDIAGAEAILARVSRSRSGQRAALHARLEGYIADAKGDRSGAIDGYQRALKLHPSGSNGVISKIMLVESLARDGQLERAIALRHRVEIDRDAAKVVGLMLAEADLVLAIAGQKAQTLNEEEVHAWVRDALAHNHTKNLLILLARALAERGDDELSNHCLLESNERFSWCRFEQTWPAMHAWVTARASSAG
jgi:hypothetical protein